jgi:hypothetical protein
MASVPFLIDGIVRKRPPAAAVASMRRFFVEAGIRSKVHRRIMADARRQGKSQNAHVLERPAAAPVHSMAMSPARSWTTLEEAWRRYLQISPRFTRAKRCAKTFEASRTQRESSCDRTPYAGDSN